MPLQLLRSLLVLFSICVNLRHLRIPFQKNRLICYEVSLEQSAWHGTCFSAVLPSQVIVILPVCL